MNIKHHELVEVANEFLKNYDMELGIPIEFNSRLKRACGRFVYKKFGIDYIPYKIQMSVDFMLNHPKEHIIDVFKHELVHYALCAAGKPFNDGDKYFEDELKKYNISRTHSYQYLGDLHVYVCKNCNSTIERKRKIPKTAYCACSMGPNLEYKGIITKKAAKNS